MDGLQRVIQTQKDARVENLGLGAVLSGPVGYDALGRVASQSQPCFKAAKPAVDAPAFDECEERHPTFTVHDALGRPLEITAPRSRRTTFQYQIATAPDGRTVRRTSTIDAKAKVRVTDRDASDRVVAVEEHLTDDDGARTPRTTYYYTPLGELERITDAAGNVTIAAYDLAGRRKHLTSKDSGTTAFRYDAAGNLVRKETSNLGPSRPITYEYNRDRLVRIVFPDSDPVEFEYGTSGNQKGRVELIKDEVGSESRTYGVLGEVTSSTRVVKPLRPGDVERSFTTRFKFDLFGRMLEVTYPDGEALEYAYDEGGLLRSAVGRRPATGIFPAQEQTYLSKLGYDEVGQRVALTLGNNVQTTYGYEADTRRLSTLTTTTPSGNRVLQAIAYSYDAADNITDVVNALGEATDERAGATEYHYEYDDLHRLTVARGTAKARPGVEDKFVSTFRYSDVHNMDRNVQVRELISTLSLEPSIERPAHSNHDWTYQYTGTGPHQATRIGDTALGYDANGNTLVECHAGPSEVCAGTPGATGAVSTAKLRRFAWNEENWLKAVVDGGGQNVTRFLYDAGGERVVKMGQSGVSITVGQFFAVKNGIYATKHIFAGETRLVSKLEPLRRNVEPDDDGTPGAVQDLPGCEPSDYTPRKCYAPIVGIAADGSSSPANFRPMTYYYHPDHLGSTSWLTDQYGEVQERVEYYPYGEVWREDREQRRGHLRRTQSFLFTSKEFDEETGLTYFGARYYNSARARWLSTDPAGPWRSPTAVNLFQYGLWNPIRFIDPDGLAEACPPNSICPVGRLEGGLNDVRAFSAGFFGVSSEPTIRLPGFHEGGRVRCNKATCWTEFTASQPPPLRLQVLAKDNPIEEAGKEVRDAVDALTLPFAAASFANAVIHAPRVLTAGQVANLKRFRGGFKKGIDVATESLGEGRVRFRAEVPGKVPGSKAIYEKVVDASGKTIEATKTTLDPRGKIVHVKDKLE